MVRVDLYTNSACSNLSCLDVELKTWRIKCLCHLENQLHCNSRLKWPPLDKDQDVVSFSIYNLKLYISKMMFILNILMERFAIFKQYLFFFLLAYIIFFYKENVLFLPKWYFMLNAFTELQNFRPKSDLWGLLECFP